MSQPGFFFYTGDWIKDTRCLSLEARGAWVDLLCALHEAGGSVTWPLRAYDQYWGTIDHNGIVYSAREILDELDQLDICELVTHANKLVTVTSRRLSREAKCSESNRKRQERFRQKQKNNGPVTEISNGSSSSSSSSSSLQSHLKMQTPAPPAAPLHPKKQKSNGLDPEIKKWGDAVLAVDRIKFQGRLAAWIKAAERNYRVEVIASSLERFVPYAKEVRDWWPYLDAILDKQEIIHNARNTEAESAQYKAEDKETAQWFGLGSIVKSVPRR